MTYTIVKNYCRQSKYFIIQFLDVLFLPMKRWDVGRGERYPREEEEQGKRGDVGRRERYLREGEERLVLLLRTFIEHA